MFNSFAAHNAEDIFFVLLQSFLDDLLVDGKWTFSLVYGGFWHILSCGDENLYRTFKG